MDTNHNLPILRRQREDGWTPDVQEAFIVALVDYGSVRVAAGEVDRHVTSAYRLRGRDPAFARAWDAARRMAYARLRDEAMDRALNGTQTEVWLDGQYYGVRRVRNDRLLMALLAHLKHEAAPHALMPPDNDTVEDRRSDAIGTALEVLTMPPPPPPPPLPVQLRPARGRFVAAGVAPGVGSPTL